MFYAFKRSVPRKATNIGAWETCLKVVNMVALVVNVGMFCFVYESVPRRFSLFLYLSNFGNIPIRAKLEYYAF